MNGFNPYLADVLASMNATPSNDPFAAGAAASGIAPPAPPPQTSPMFDGSNSASTDAAPIVIPGVQPAPSLPPAGPPLPPGGVGPTGNTNAVPGGPAPAVNVNAPPEPQREFTLHPAMGGVVPAHEVDLRGPTMKAAQGAANTAQEETIGRVDDRSQEAAAHEYNMALAQEREARVREAAWQQSIAERDEEMAQRQADFDQSVKALSQTSIDPNRFWSTRSTGQKISAMIGLALGGFLQGARGGSNPGMDIINTAIDRDVRAQEAQFQVARDVVNGRQTAFGLAMQKYQNADAARSMARASAIDAVQAQIAQNAALWKGTDAANRADVAMASLQQEKMNQAAQWIKFILPQAGPRVFVDEDGITYTNKEAQDLKKEFRGYGHEREKIGLTAAGNMITEREKAQAAQAGKSDEGARHIASQLQTAGVPQARAAAEMALKALNKSPGGKAEVAGRKIAGTVPVVGEALGNSIMGDDANAREQAYWAYANAAMKAMMGNVTDSEMSRAQKQLGSASDPESRRRAIASTLETLSEIEKNAKAGESPAAQAEFERRREEAKGQRDLVPKGATASGWK